LALFCAGLFWVIGSPTYVHPDEEFYTNSAIEMVHTGEYWTPFYPDGRLRLEKPILTYWAVAASFHAFGINLFASRFPSALAGVLLVCLTYQLARTLTASRPVSILAAAIIGGNLELIIISMRATPDALVCLFSVVSIWGIARVWFQRDQSCVGPLLAFGGMGLAVQTKGFLGLWPLAAAVIFWAMARPEWRLTKKLLHGPAIALGITLAGFWHAVMFYRHGNSAFQGLYEDQLGSYVSFNPLPVLQNTAAYVLGGLENFLPWVLLLLATVFGRRAALAAFGRDHRPLVLFGLIPFTLLTVAFSFGNIRAQRYLTSALPPMAALLGRGGLEMGTTRCLVRDRAGNPGGNGPVVGGRYQRLRVAHRGRGRNAGRGDRRRDGAPQGRQALVLGMGCRADRHDIFGRARLPRAANLPAGPPSPGETITATKPICHACVHLAGSPVARRLATCANGRKGPDY